MNHILFIINIFLLLTSIPKTYSEEEDEVYYVAEFTDEIKDCDGFNNDAFKCDSLKVGYIEGEGDEDGSLGLSGHLDVLKDITDEYTISLKVFKETDLTKEFMYAVSGSLCETLHKPDTPWWPLVKCLNSSECPIKQDVYPVQNMALSLDFAKDVLRYEFVGNYDIQLTILDQMEKELSCHIISAGISEKTKE